VGCITQVHGSNASYLYLKLAKTQCLSYYLFNKIGEQEGRTGSTRKWVCGGCIQAMYTHVSKCTNDKRKKEKKSAA
jgi:hypothetical protein